MAASSQIRPFPSRVPRGGDLCPMCVDDTRLLEPRRDPIPKSRPCVRCGRSTTLIAARDVAAGELLPPVIGVVQRIPGPSWSPTCRCGAVSTVLTGPMLRGLVASRLWCLRCYDRSLRRGVLLGRVIAWSLALALVVAVFWWRLHL